eukprot:c19752_g1_i3.p2 GENE.c19752_g1_i3~~c19752_g1_i3.p2  ORF type:complete len:296 (-),score=46.33 c19752_g1_i3:144-1031(-)
MIHQNVDEGVLVVTLGDFVQKLLYRCKMEESKPMSTPAVSEQRSANTTREHEQVHEMMGISFRSVVGSLMYLAVIGRPDIAIATNRLARQVENPDKTHWQALKRVLRYLKATPHFGLKFTRMGNQNFDCSSDSNWGLEANSGRSTSGFVCMLMGGAISWVTKLQSSVALSTMEAEYVAASLATCEIQHLLLIAEDMNMNISLPIKLKIDNTSAIQMAENEGNHSRAKHINLRVYSFREKVKEGIIKPMFVPTTENVADMMTKPLDRVKFQLNVQRLMWDASGLLSQVTPTSTDAA